MKRLTMDKAKTSEWVKLIDCDYESGVKVWLRLIQKKCYEMGFEKSQGLGDQVFSLKTWRRSHNIYVKFEIKVWKGLGHNGMNGTVEWM